MSAAEVERVRVSILWLNFTVSNTFVSLYITFYLSVRTPELFTLDNVGTLTASMWPAPFRLQVDSCPKYKIKQSYNLEFVVTVS